MKKLLAATMFCGALAMPAFAQDETTTCADFTAMDAAAQTEALASIQDADAADVDTDTTAGVEGSTDDGASAEVTGDVTAEATDDAAGAIGAEVTASAVVEACADNPDMLVIDAIEQAQSD